MWFCELLRICLGDGGLVTVDNTQYENLLAENERLRERNKELEAVMRSIRSVAGIK